MLSLKEFKERQEVAVETAKQEYQKQTDLICEQLVPVFERYISEIKTSINNQLEEVITNTASSVISQIPGPIVFGNRGVRVYLNLLFHRVEGVDWTQDVIHKFVIDQLVRLLGSNGWNINVCTVHPDPLPKSPSEYIKMNDYGYFTPTWTLSCELSFGY